MVSTDRENTIGRIDGTSQRSSPSTPPLLEQRLKLARRRRGAMAARSKSLRAPVLAMCPSAQTGGPSVPRFQRGGDQRTETRP